MRLGAAVLNCRCKGRTIWKNTKSTETAIVLYFGLDWVEMEYLLDILIICMRGGGWLNNLVGGFGQSAVGSGDALHEELTVLQVRIFK